MKILSRDHVVYALSGQAEPVLTVQPGEAVVFETYDCYGGSLLPEGNTFADFDRRYGNPATGPLRVEGARPGDMLRIEIEKIELGPVGILDIGPNSGAMKGIAPEPVIHRIPVSDGFLTYKGKVKVPVKPMIGVIGTAPAGEPVRTMTPMDHGGNMDCTKIEEGATLYLPVFVEGGLLFMGDLHGIMGDGEVGNCGLEIEGRVRVRVHRERELRFPYPLVENPDQWITIAYGETLDEASEKAVRQMLAFLTESQGLDPVDAGMLMDMAGDLVVCQIVNPYKTARVEIPKKVLADMKRL